MSGNDIVLSESLSYLRPRIMNDLSRYGRKGDGGYVLPASALGNVDGFLSLGLGHDVSFEVAILEKQKDLLLHAYDPTVNERSIIKWCFGGIISRLRGSATTAEVKGRFNTLQQYRLLFGNNVHFTEFVSNKVSPGKEVNVDTIFRRAESRTKFLLKVDIEGSEYRVIPGILKFQEKIDILIVEFHNTDVCRSTFEQLVSALNVHFNIVHFHANNFSGLAADGLPETCEITFLNDTYPIAEEFRSTLPLETLDYPNNPSKPDFKFNFR